MFIGKNRTLCESCPLFCKSICLPHKTFSSLTTFVYSADVESSPIIGRPTKLMPRASNASLKVPHVPLPAPHVEPKLPQIPSLPPMDRPRATTLKSSTSSHSVTSSLRSSPERARKLQKKSSPHLSNSASSGTNSKSALKKISGVEYAKERSDFPDLLPDDPFRRQTLIRPLNTSMLNLSDSLTPVVTGRSSGEDVIPPVPPLPPIPKAWSENSHIPLSLKYSSSTSSATGRGEFLDISF